MEEWAVRVIQGMYMNARSRVRVNGQYSEEFGVGVCQGYVPLTLDVMRVAFKVPLAFHTPL